MPGLIHLLRAVTKPSVITLSLLSLLSTVLNIIQVLNGNLCFSTVVTDTLVDTRDPVGDLDSRTSRLSTSGYEEGSHNVALSTACWEAYKPSAHNFFCAYNSTHLNCHQKMHFSQVTYTNDISYDCRTNRSYEFPFVIVVSPGTNFMQGLQAPEPSFYCSSNLYIARCSLNGQFYAGFILACIAFIVAMIVLNAMSDGVLRGFFAWLATGEYGSAAYDWLENRGFFSYCDNHRNKPFKLLPGQRVLRLCMKSDEDIMSQENDEETLLQRSHGVTTIRRAVVADRPEFFFYHSANLTIQVSSVVNDSVVDDSVVDDSDVDDSVVDGNSRHLMQIRPHFSRHLTQIQVYFVDWRGPRNLNSVRVDAEGYAKLIRCMEDLSKGIPTLDRKMGHILSIEEIVEFIFEASEDANLMEVTFGEEKVFFGN